ncbi:MAG: PAS domain S-box protein [Gemmatimonadaceae bacterium]|nr:PAS domain S-box protein [Gemmatimonadaceae bacterium]
MTATGTYTGATFVTIAEGSDELIARFDAGGRYLYLNAALERMTGLTRAVMLGRTLGEVGFAPEVDAAVRDAIGRVFAGETVVLSSPAASAERPAARRYETRFMPETDATGAVVAAVAVARDVTGQKQMEAALEESEVRFDAVFENVPFGMAVSTREAHGYATSANTMLANMLGYTRAELAQLHFSEFTHADDTETDARLLQQVKEGVRDGYSMEKRLIRKDGTVFWSHLTVCAARADDGSIRYVVGLTEDITERKEIESELRSSEERFRALVEHSSDLIAILETDGRVRYASPSQRALVGYDEADIRTMNALDLIHPDDLARATQRMELALQVESLAPEMPLRFRGRDGSWRSLMVTLTNMHHNPAVRGFVVNARDVTSELRLQEQLTQSQKMEALGQLAGGVAHDFNNILAAISGYAELLLMELPADATTAADAREIAKATARGAGVTKQLLAFSRRQTLETEVLDLAAVVRDTGRMLRALLPASIELELPAEGDPAVPVHAARAQVEQIVMNLAVNARDAMPMGGRLRIRVAREHGEAGEQAIIVVSDSGTGMTDEVRARAFEPFFTTKPKGHGTGLGLATVYGLVHQFGGKIDVESAAAVGTHFTIALPIAEGFETQRAEPRPPGTPHAGDAHVLLAEDEPQLRRVLARALRHAGYRVTTAGDGAAALSAIHDTDFDLVISDIAMPRLGGRELAAAVEAGWPGLPIILMSGYAELGATPDAISRLPENVPAFIEKPFEVERLLQIAAEVLHARITTMEA